LKLLDQRKQAKLQWLQDLGQINEDNLNNLRRESSRHFRGEKKKRKYLKDKINGLVIKSENKNTRDLYRGIKKFKKGYQHTSNLAKDENGDLLVDSYNILNRWKNYYFQLLNIHKVSDVRQIEIHTAELLVPDPSPFEVEAVIAKLKKYILPCSDQILVKLIQA
jgi:hypothetical protein